MMTVCILRWPCSRQLRPISYRTCLCWTSGEQNSCNNTSWYNRNIQFLALWNENWAVSAGVLPLGASCTVVREGEREAQSEGCAAPSMYGSAPRSKQPEWAERSAAQYNYRFTQGRAGVQPYIITSFKCFYFDCYLLPKPKKKRKKIGTKKIAPQIWT